MNEMPCGIGPVRDPGAGRRFNQTIAGKENCPIRGGENKPVTRFNDLNLLRVNAEAHEEPDRRRQLTHAKSKALPWPIYVAQGKARAVGGM